MPDIRGLYAQKYRSFSEAQIEAILNKFAFDVRSGHLEGSIASTQAVKSSDFESETAIQQFSEKIRRKLKEYGLFYAVFKEKRKRIIFRLRDMLLSQDLEEDFEIIQSLQSDHSRGFGSRPESQSSTDSFQSLTLHHDYNDESAMLPPINSDSDENLDEEGILSFDKQKEKLAQLAVEAVKFRLENSLEVTRVTPWAEEDWEVRINHFQHRQWPKLVQQTSPSTSESTAPSQASINAVYPSQHDRLAQLGKEAAERGRAKLSISYPGEKRTRPNLAQYPWRVAYKKAPSKPEHKNVRSGLVLAHRDTSAAMLIMLGKQFPIQKHLQNADARDVVIRSLLSPKHSYPTGISSHVNILRPIRTEPLSNISRLKSLCAVCPRRSLFTLLKVPFSAQGYLDYGSLCSCKQSTVFNDAAQLTELIRRGRSTANSIHGRITRIRKLDWGSLPSKNCCGKNPYHPLQPQSKTIVLNHISREEQAPVSRYWPRYDLETGDIAALTLPEGIIDAELYMAIRRDDIEAVRQLQDV
jgi:hypothetical protein